MIAAVVWLATETLRSGDGPPARERVRYSALILRAQERPGTIRRVEFVTHSQRVLVDLRDGRRLETTYPTEAAQLDFQKQLEREHIPFDARQGSSGTLWTILTSLLPFVLLFGFWIALMQATRRRNPADAAPDDEPHRWGGGRAR